MGVQSSHHGSGEGLTSVADSVFTPPETEATLPFWDAAREGRLVLPKCRSCGAFAHYPRLFCPACGASDPDWREVSGRGQVYSYTVVHLRMRPVPEDWPAPYVVGLVELDEGPLLMSNVVGCAPEDVYVGMPVRVTFGDSGMPLFQPD